MTRCILQRVAQYSGRVDDKIDLYATIVEWYKNEGAFKLKLMMLRLAFAKSPLGKYLFMIGHGTDGKGAAWEGAKTCCQFPW